MVCFWAEQLLRFLERECPSSQAFAAESYIKQGRNVKTKAETVLAENKPIIYTKQKTNSSSNSSRSSDLGVMGPARYQLRHAAVVSMLNPDQL